MSDAKNTGKDTQIGIRLTAGLKQKVIERANETDYSSISDYVIGLIRYDLARRQPHSLTSPLSKEPADIQEQFERDIFSAYRQGGAVTGSALDQLVEELFTDNIREEIAASFKDLLKQRLSNQMASASKPKPKKKKTAK